MKNEVIDKPATQEEQLKAKYPLACFLDELINEFKESLRILVVGSYAVLLGPFLHEDYKPKDSVWKDIAKVMSVSISFAALDKRIAIGLSIFWMAMCLTAAIFEAYEAYTKE